MQNTPPDFRIQILFHCSIDIVVCDIRLYEIVRIRIFDSLFPCVADLILIEICFIQDSIILNLCTSLYTQLYLLNYWKILRAICDSGRTGALF